VSSSLVHHLDSNLVKMTRSFSVSSGVLALCFMGLAALTLSIALVFVLLGYWLVLPFAGLECAGLCLAYIWLAKQRGDYEYIKLLHDDIHVEQSFSGKVTRSSFNRYWVQLNVVDSGRGRLSVFLRSHGNQTEIGRLLTIEEKKQLIEQIKNGFLG